MRTSSTEIVYVLTKYYEYSNGGRLDNGNLFFFFYKFNFSETVTVRDL